jgi:hypothetical protein
MCLFVLCIFGVLDRPLLDLSLCPAVASLLCLCTAAMMLLEDVALTDALLANPGGFFMPVICSVAILAAARAKTRRYLIPMSLIVGLGGWMFSQITHQLFESVPEFADISIGLFCVAFALILEDEAKPALMLAFFGFHLCDMIGYVAIIASGQSAYVILGDGIKGAIIVGMPVAIVALCRLRNAVRLEWRQWMQRRSEPQTQTENA